MVNFYSWWLIWPLLDYRNWKRLVHDNGVFGWRWAFWLHREAPKAEWEVGMQVLPGTHLGHRISSQERGVPQRPQAWKPLTRLWQDPQDSRLRSEQHVREGRDVKNCLRFSLLRCSRNDRWQTLQRSINWYMELGCRPLCHDLRVPSVRGSQNVSAV